MRPEEKIRDQETIDTITQLINNGAEKMSVIMRHSDRFYHKDTAMEAFMGLTEKGKEFAMKLGSQLPERPRPRLFSSPFGRCIETAYLIDKGYIKTHCVFNGHNSQAVELSPFYIKDIHKAIDLVRDIGNGNFLRKWFDREISENIMLNPEIAADTIADFMVKQISAIDDGEIAICVSHDWNLFPLKEYKLGLPHEDYGSVGYLESVIVFEKEGKNYIANYQK
ncbi:MAG: histidine phosphatase family protein, partial [Desulfamplus sp.]|nr:histidine phosphatase family protein [Desulfamplus sp.]